ncbi:MAG: hypothetical protein JWN00_102, partial [Actinomycetia bacterium]|nr:hypothetical protein [Actinomycetes bacterium]
AVKQPAAGRSVAPASTAGRAGAQVQVLTGARLNALLLSGSSMPKGFRLNADGARNTGDAIAPASSAPVARSAACAMLLQTSWVRAAGIGSATFAQNDYGDSGRQNQVAQELDGFQGTGARAVIGRLKRVFAECATFKDKSGGMVVTVKISTSKLAGLGDEAIRAVLTSTAWMGGTTLVAVRVGQTVVTTLVSSSGKDKGAAVKFAVRLAKNVKAAG